MQEPNIRCRVPRNKRVPDQQLKGDAFVDASLQSKKHLNQKGAAPFGTAPLVLCREGGV